MKTKLLFLILLLSATSIISKSQEDIILHNYINQVMNFRNAKYDSVKTLLSNLLVQDSIVSKNRHASVHYALAELFLQSSQYDSSDWHYRRALTILDNYHDNYYLGRVYLGLAYLINFKANQNLALEYNLKAEKIFRQIQDQQMLGRVYKRIGDIFYVEKNHESAMKYYTDAQRIAEQLADTLNLVRVLNAMSSLYDDMDMPEESDLIVNRAIELGKLIKCTRCLAISYSQLGINYHFQGRYDEAIDMYWQEFEMNKLMGATFEQFYVYQNISAAYHKADRQTEALEYAYQAADLGLSSGSLSIKHDVFRNKHRILKAMGRYPEALNALEMQMLYKDSLAEVNRTKVIEGLRAQYEDELKLQRITELEQEKTIQVLQAKAEQQLRWGLLIFIFLFVVLLIIIIGRYRHQLRFTKTLDVKNQQLNEAKQFRDRMFAIISHDLKSPLSSFSSISSTLSEYYEQIDAVQAKEYLQKMASSAQSLETQFKNLLEWSISQLSKRNLRIEHVNFSKSTQEVIDFYRLNIDLKNIVISSEIDERIHIKTDREFLHTILRNLISNAIKFTPRNGSIFIKAFAFNNECKIIIEDSGIGIAREDLPKLFELHSDKKEIGNSSEKGTGLGLVLVKELVDQLGGNIQVESQLGKGTTFTINLMQHQSEKAA